MKCIVWYCLVIDHGAHTHKIPRDYSLWLSLRTPHRKIARAKISCSQSLLLVDLKLLPVGLCRFPTYINSTEDVSGYRNGENWYHRTFFATPLADQSINYKLLRGIGLVALLAYKCLRSYSVPYHVIHVVPCSSPFSPASPQCRTPSLGNLSAPFFCSQALLMSASLELLQHSGTSWWQETCWRDLKRVIQPTEFGMRLEPQRLVSQVIRSEMQGGTWKGISEVEHGRRSDLGRVNWSELDKITASELKCRTNSVKPWR